MADDELSPYLVTTHTQQPRSPVIARSRVASRYTSRVPSRLGSRVPSRAGSGAELRDEGLRALTRAMQDNSIDTGRQENDIPGPDFVDPAVFDEDEMMNDGEIEEEVNESEMKRIIMGRAKGWVDWAVGWMDLRGEEEMWDDDDNGDGAAPNTTFKLDEKVPQRRRLRAGGGDIGDSVVAAPPPPEDRDAGALADARWLLGLASRLVV